MEHIVELSTRDAETQARNGRVHSRHKVRHRNICAGSVLRIIARDHLEHDCRILNRPAHRANVIKRWSERDYAAITNAAIGRLETDDSTVGCRSANRAASVGAERAKTKLRSRRGAWTAGRTAGVAIQGPGIVHRAEVGCR